MIQKIVLFSFFLILLSNNSNEYPKLPQKRIFEDVRNNFDVPMEEDQVYEENFKHLGQQRKMPVNVPITFSRFIPISIPPPPIKVQKTLPIIITRPAPINIHAGLEPKISFPGYSGYGYPCGSRIEFPRSKRTTN
nr:uncharacterized protein LOC111414381 [Onthophagus taurus]